MRCRSILARIRLHGFWPLSKDLPVKEAILLELFQGFDAHEACIAIPLVQNLLNLILISQCERLASNTLFAFSMNRDLVIEHTLDVKALLHSRYIQEPFAH